MLIEWLYELKDSVDKHGIRFGLLFALYAIYRKERRNYRLDKRDEAIFENQRVIMDKLGVGEQWRGQVGMSNNEEVQSLKRLYLSLQVGINQVYQQRRVKKMNPNTNWITLIPALVGAIKLILQPFGIDLSHVTDQQVNDVVNGIAAVATIIGILLPHKKGVVIPNVPTQPTGDSGAAV